MNRREFLQCAAVLAAGATALPSSWVMSAEQTAFLAAQPSYLEQRQPTLFSARQRAAVAAVAEQIIPATDTPGATEAGVPRFIELMVADWFTDAERQFFMRGLAGLQERAGGDFSGLSPEAQLTLLEQLEEEGSDAAWYEIGNVMRLWDDTAPFICQIKELTVLGFFLSEVGASQALRINPMGVFEGDIALGAGETTYAAELPTRSIAGEYET